MNQIRKKNSSGGYKSATQFRDDWQLMFRNARTYNQEGSWVYVDAEEMEKVFQEAYNRLVTGSGIPGSDESNAPASSAPPVRNKGSVKLNVRQVVSDDDDDDYLSGNSDDE
jgi:ATP-dependent helicase STH1/SNF2